jgi:ABC-type nitrate/sulfonate/bicarbonate transport system substrate-binding protein
LRVSAALLGVRPDRVARALGRSAAVGPWAAANPEAALALLGRETGARAEWVSYAYGVDLHEHLYVDLSERSLAGLEDFKNFLFQWDFIPANFSVRQWVDPEPLASIGALRHSA